MSVGARVIAENARRAAFVALASLLIGLNFSNAATSGNEDSLANERLPVNAAHMETLWEVNCSAAYDQVLMLARNRNSAPGDSQVQQNLLESLKRCGFIYNTPHTQTYRQCPDFKRWERWLRGAKNNLDGCS